MYISKMTIRNFRNFTNATFIFKEGINTIIGENGSGKSNAFFALRILLDQSLPRYLKLIESDFNRALNDWRGHWIIISVDFDKLGNSEELQSMMIHATGHMNSSSKGNYTFIFRPKTAIRQKLFELSELSEEPDEKAKDLADILQSITIDDYESIFHGRASADFSNDDIYRTYIGDFDKIKFPNPEEKATDTLGVKINEFSLSEDISCTFIKALRDVESELRTYRNNPLITLLRGKGKNIEIEKIDDISSKVKKLNESISGLDEINDVAKGISYSLYKTVGATYAPGVKIKSEIPEEIEKVLQSLKLWVSSPDELDYEGKIWELSLGAANLLYLALKLQEYEQVHSLEKAANVLLIEEPEAHLHTHIQKSLFSNIGKKRTQVFITTHSTHISSVSRISSMTVLARGNKKAEVFHPANKLAKPDITRLERYLDAVRSNLLFAKSVLMVEGDAEEIIIPTLIKNVFGITLDELGISVINIRSTGFKNIASIFHPDRIKRKCAILTDLDKSIVKLPDDPDNDDKYLDHCRKSQKAGKERKESIDEYCKGNPFVEAFYAEYTFEVEFLICGNEHEVTKLIPQVYSNEKKEKSATKNIENKSVAVAGRQILQMAEYTGKGWFAVLLSDKIFFMTYIPQYILKSLKFILSDFPQSLIKSIMMYRLNCFIKYKDEDVDSLKDLLESIKNTKDSSLLSQLFDKYYEILPDDPLTKLINS